MSDYYLLARIKREPLEASRFLFDYEYYLKNKRNIRIFKTFKLKNKIDAWKHFLKNNSHRSLNYHFHPVTNKVRTYYNYIQNVHLNLDGSNFDEIYYLEHNQDVKVAFELAKSNNSNFAFKHFLTNGLCEMRPFQILAEKPTIPYTESDTKTEVSQYSLGTTPSTCGDDFFEDEQILQALANLLSQYWRDKPATSTSLSGKIGDSLLTHPYDRSEKISLEEHLNNDRSENIYPDQHLLQ